MKKMEWKTIVDISGGQDRKIDVQDCRKKSRLILFVSFALIASFLQFLILNFCAKSSGIVQTKNMYAVAVAKIDIQHGEMLTEKNIKIVYMNLGESKESFILNSELNGFFGKKLLAYTNVNTPILKNAFASETHQKSMTEKIPPGKRFFVLDAELGPLSSLLHIGDKIDVIAHMEIPEFGKVTESVLDAVEIIGIGENIGDEDGNSTNQSLSFYVTAEEFKTLSFMKQYAHFSIALRNPNDMSSESGSAVTLNKFIQDKRIQKIMKNDSFKIIK